MFSKGHANVKISSDQEKKTNRIQGDFDRGLLLLMIPLLLSLIDSVKIEPSRVEILLSFMRIESKIKNQGCPINKKRD